MTKHWTVLIAASLATLLALFAPAPVARADIFRWEYINPADPSQGKQPSTMLTPDGAGAYATPGTNLSNRNLTMAYLIGADLGAYHDYWSDYSYPSDLTGTNLTQADLTNASLYGATLTGANLSQANLTNARFWGITSGFNADFTYWGADLAGANLSGAEVRGANFRRYNVYVGTGITATQLYSTASYQAHDLTGITLADLDLTGWNLAGQNLTRATFHYATLTNANLSQANLANASFDEATLTGANLSGADVRMASLVFAGVTADQIYSTASYQAHDLTGIRLSGNFSGANFAGQNLTEFLFRGSLGSADFSQANLTRADIIYSDLTNAKFIQADLTDAYLGAATLTGANFTGARVRGAKFSGTNITPAQLYSTASYQAGDLTGIALGGTDLAGVNLAGQNLTNASFVTNDGNYAGANLSGANLSGANAREANFLYATLTGADFTGAEVRGVNFGRDIDSEIGITLAQLYATASYQAHDLSGISLVNNPLTGGNFAGQNLANANLSGADLTAANLSAADARGATFPYGTLTGANTRNLIQSNSHIAGLDLTAGATLVVRDYDGNPAASPPTGPLPIVVEQHLVMDTTGTLRLVFDADPWDSTISFAAGIPVTRGGTLDLTFAPGVNVATQIGRTIDLFDWTGVSPTGAFTVSSPYAWDLSNLYTTGEVTLAAAPTLPGDFNIDGTVDAADYIIWRKNGGQHAEYNTWRANFGRTTTSGAIAGLPSSAVPEPAALFLLLFAVGLCSWLRWSPGHAFWTEGLLVSHSPCHMFRDNPNRIHACCSRPL